MSRPKRMTRWYVNYGEFRGTTALTKKQAERRAAQAVDPSKVTLTLRCSRHSKKFPYGFERDYGSKS